MNLRSRSEQMSLVKGTNTKPEIIVRKILHSLGYRYRLHDKKLPRRPDIVFASRKKVIFVHGCFWHRHGATDCWRSRLPKSRLDFWIPKLDRNVSRDKENLDRLHNLGWKTETVWECELRMSKRDVLIRRMIKFLGARRA
jgi:DNA mismatch endonuclease (patch repair protein)